MFAGEIIAVAVVAMFASILPADWLEKKNLDKLATVFFVIGLIASIYSAITGIYLLVVLEDPLANADRETLGKALIILAIKFWPYVLIGAGGICCWSYATILWNRR